MFSEGFGSYTCLERKLRQFYRREVVDMWEIPYLTRNHENDHNLPKNDPNYFIFTHKLDTQAFGLRYLTLGAK